jgi:hypothetical protein
MAKGASRAKSTSRRRANGKQHEYLYGEGPARAAEIRIGRTATRVRKHAARLKSYGLPDPSVVSDLVKAFKFLKSAETKLAKVPKDWRPKRGTLGATPLEEGSRVMVHSKVANRYLGAFDTDKPLKVVQIDGSRIICETKYKGMLVRVPMSRTHVQFVK